MAIYKKLGIGGHEFQYWEFLTVEINVPSTLVEATIGLYEDNATYVANPNDYVRKYTITVDDNEVRYLNVVMPYPNAFTIFMNTIDNNNQTPFTVLETFLRTQLGFSATRVV